MSGLISRQKVLNTLDFADNALTGEERTVENYKELLTECIKVLPSNSENPNKWIPCSERLPEEENKRYWICTDCGYQCECRWTNVNHIWTYLTTDWHWHIMDVPQYSKVVAWMPLPEPYNADMRGE